MTNRIIYIDDDSKDLHKYQRLFETENDRLRFEIIPINAQELDLNNSSEQLKSIEPDLFLIDLDLSKPKNKKVLGISGVAASTELREKFPYLPLILFTRKNIFNRTYSVMGEINSGLDEIIYKDDINKSKQTCKEFIAELIGGYKILKDKKPMSYEDLFLMLKAPKIDHDKISKTIPASLYSSNWPIHLIANWIRKTLLHFPGILYDPVHSATLLGLSKEAFLSADAQEIFLDAKYSSIFSPADGRWWKSKIHEIANKMMNIEEKDMPLNEGFPLAMDRINPTKGKIERSKCIYSNESPAEWVCCILNEPIMIRYSLSYRADSRPQAMDEARISYKAIRTSDGFREELIDPSSMEMLPEIRKKRIRKC